MSVVLPLGIHGSEDRSTDPLGIIKGHIVLSGDLIYTTKPEAGNLTQLVWILLQDLPASGTEMLIDLGRCRRGDLVRGQ